VVETSGAPDSVTLAQAFVAASLSRGRIALAGGDRAAAFALLEAALQDATDYPALAKDDEGEVLAGPDAQALKAVLDGELPLVVEADRASDLRALAALKGEHRALRLIVVGAAEAELAADALAAADIPVVLDPSRNLPYSFDRLASSTATAAELSEDGVAFAIAALDEPHANPGYLAQHAGRAVAYGLSWDEAFDAVTGAPARLYGLEQDLGSLEVGKLADIVIWDGDPLEVMSGALHVIIAGAEQPTRSRQSALRDRYLGPEDPTALPRAYRGD
jgi:imidazolonepropionase-like amidohydrolase